MWQYLDDVMTILIRTLLLMIILKAVNMSDITYNDIAYNLLYLKVAQHVTDFTCNWLYL